MNEMPLAREQHVIVQDLSDEMLIYDQFSHRVNHLEPAVALVWRNCNRTPTASLADLLEREFNVRSGQTMLAFALERLGRQNLLQKPVARRAKVHAA